MEDGVGCWGAAISFIHLLGIVDGSAALIDLVLLGVWMDVWMCGGSERRNRSGLGEFRVMVGGAEGGRLYGIG